MRTRSSGWWFAAALGTAVVLGLGTPALAADVTGTWKWSVERNGQTFETTLKLKQDGDKLTGTISGRQGANDTEITDGKVTGDTVTFKVTREFNGNKVVQTYQGKISGDTIKGERKSERDGETQTREWEAKREK
jgi:hypothetical protein